MKSINEIFDSVKNVFSFNRNGHGVSKNVKKFVPNLKNMPRFFIDNFTRLLSLNIITLPLIAPALIAFYIYITSGTTPSQTNMIFSSFYGANIYNPSAVSQAYLGIFGRQLDLQAMSTSRVGIIIGLALLTFLIWGVINAGAAYCTREAVKRQPLFIFSDFFYAVKRNWRQALPMGLIDLSVILLLALDIVYCSRIGGSLWLDFLFFAVCAIAIIYFFMRFYIYLMMVTFDMKIRKIFKNAFIFSILGIKRNLMALLGIAVIVILNALLCVLFFPLGLSFPIVLPFFYLIPCLILFKTYGAYPVIEKYMITTSPEPDTANDDEDEE